MHGLGRVIVEPNEPVFHAEWERIVFAINFVVPCNGDESRYSIEKMNPVHYLSSRYYEHWLFGFENILVEQGIVDRGDLDRRTAKFRDSSFGELPRLKNPRLVESITRIIREGTPYNREIQRIAKFKVGDSVRAKNLNPVGHTRLPRYVRGKRGIIVKVNGAFVFPDTNALRKGENPQHVYGVRFEAKDLWGEESAEKGREAVYLDLWENYIEQES
jgi:nitrile hydratase subunit beta